MKHALTFELTRDGAAAMMQALRREATAVEEVMSELDCEEPDRARLAALHGELCELVNVIWWRTEIEPDELDQRFPGTMIR